MCKNGGRMRVSVPVFYVLLCCFSTGIYADTSLMLYNTENSGILPFPVTCMAGDADGNMWFGYSYRGRDDDILAGATCYDGETWTQVTTAAGLAGDNVIDIVSQGDVVYFATNGGLSVYDGSGGTTMLDGFHIERVILGQSGVIWVSGHLSAERYIPLISRFDGVEWTTWPLKVTCWDLAPDNSLWAGVEDCLYHMDGLDIERFDEPRFRNLGDIACDPEARVWLSGSPVYYRDYELTVFQGMPANVVEYHDGVVTYVLSDEDGVSLAVNDGTAWYRHPMSVPGSWGYHSDYPINFAPLLYAAADGSYWYGGTFFGVAHYEYDELSDGEYMDIPAPEMEPLPVEEPYREDEPTGPYAGWFPMHVGDTWVYEREYQLGGIGSSSDLYATAIVDTVTVEGLVHYLFLDGRTYRHDDEGHPCVGDTWAYNLNPADSLLFNQPPYNSMRDLITVTYPVGELTGYTFSWGMLHGGRAFVAPPVGLAGFGQTGDYDVSSHRLTYAIIDGVEHGKSTAVEPDATPAPFSLSAPFPNPFNASVSIDLTLPETRHATVTVYNILGQPVRMLHDGLLSAGTHRLRWDGGTNDNITTSSGIYFLTVRTGKHYAVRRALLLQ